MKTTFLTLAPGGERTWLPAPVSFFRQCSSELKQPQRPDVAGGFLQAFNNAPTKYKLPL